MQKSTMPPQSLLIAFDLEGPLSPNDNAYELMQLFPGGDKIFSVISRYDDLLAVEGRKGYEPGNTLALIVPFLVYHGISQADILRLAEAASLVPGAAELIARLHSQGWKVYCITTTYIPYARRLAQRLGIRPDEVWGTVLSQDYYQEVIPQKTLDWVGHTERDLARLHPLKDDRQIKERLDELFWGSGPELSWLLEEIRPMGGRRKLVALRTILLAHHLTLKEAVAVGDSITDWPMLQAVNQEGGLAIAFNANKYALPHASLGLASTHILDLWPVLDAWASGGRAAAEEVVKAREKAGGSGDRGHFQWLSGQSPPLEIHSRIRRLVRAQAAELG